MLPLSDIRVLDLCRFVAGPYCTTTLGDLGADIITVESPIGADEIRGWSPSADGGMALGGEFTGLNRNKRSIVLDLKKEEGRKVFYELAKKSDAIVENFRPGVVERLGVDYKTISAINPRIVYCSVSGYGQTGPRRNNAAMDFVIQGMSGIVHMTGEPGRTPCRVGIGIGDLFGAMYNTIAVLAGLELREKTGRGVFLDMSLLDTNLAMLSYYATRYFADQKDLGRTGLWHNLGGVLSGAFETKDGRYVVPQRTTGRRFHRLCEVLGISEWAKDLLSRYPNETVAWQKNREEVASTVEAAFKKITADEAVEQLNKVGIPCGKVKTITEVFKDPQVLFYKMVREVDRPPYGKVELLANPIRPENKMWKIRIPPSMAGEHTDEVLRELGKSEDEISKLKSDGVVKAWRDEKGGA